MTVLFDRVVFALASVFHLHPARLDPTVVLHPVQHRVKHAIRPLNFIPGKLFDFLNQFVTVAFTPGEQGQNQRFG